MLAVGLVAILYMKLKQRYADRAETNYSWFGGGDAGNEKPAVDLDSGAAAAGTGAEVAGRDSGVSGVSTSDLQINPMREMQQQPGRGP